MTEAPIVEVEGLIYSYKRHLAVDHATFAVERGSIHGFVGPNGAGKTTTLKVLATLVRPQGGRVRAFGLDIVAHYKEVRRRMGFMPDHFSLYRQMTVQEYLDFFAAAYGMAYEQRRRVIGDVLALTDMEVRRKDLIRGLSRGMQQRVSLARVLVHDPELLLLDEPASGLDPRARIELMEILRELRRMGKTIFISSHILSELGVLCDSVTILDRGTVRYTGPMEGLTHGDGDAMDYVIVLAEAHAATEAALRALAGVDDVSRDETEPRYRVSFRKDRLTPNDLARAVLDSGGRVVALQRDMRHLNDAFMDLTSPGIPPSAPPELPS